MRSWSFWKRELKKRLLLGPENDGIGDAWGRRIRIRMPQGGKNSNQNSRVAPRRGRRRS